jgi:hypothetical protein
MGSSRLGRGVAAEVSRVDAGERRGLKQPNGRGDSLTRLPAAGRCSYAAWALTTLGGKAVCTTRVIWNPAWLSRFRYSAAVCSRAPKFSSVSRSTHFSGEVTVVVWG